MTAARDGAPAAKFGDAWRGLFSPPVAHRGLWSPDGPPENSLGAFQAACGHGYGVELDVQLSADGEAMVFHDDDLARLTGAKGRIGDHTAHDLARLRLAGTEETIPTLADALTLIGHRALVLIELKTPAGKVGPLEQRVHEVMIDHHGPLAVLSFNPYALGWFTQHFPNVLRGLNSHAYNGHSAPGLAPEQRKAYARLEQVSIAKPHFLSLSTEVLDSAPAAALRQKGLPVITWTVRSAEEKTSLAKHCDNIIFEGFAA